MLASEIPEPTVTASALTSGDWLFKVFGVNAAGDGEESDVLTIPGGA